jgi:6-phosphofructokinase 2
MTRLGENALAIHTAGGVTGELLKRLLSDRGVRSQAIAIEGNTRENVIISESETSQQYRFGFPGPELTEAEQQSCLRSITQLDPAPKYLILSGSLPPGVSDDYYGRIVEAVPGDTRVALDVSGDALRRGVEQSVYLLKPNQRELGLLVGHAIESDNDARNAARSLIDRGKVQVMMVSLGRGGVMLVTRDEEHRINAPTVKVRSKIGAGDSTVAGMVLALKRGKSLSEAARFGVACGSAAVMTEGTELCRREDAERLYEELKRS